MDFFTKLQNLIAETRSAGVSRDFILADLQSAMDLLYAGSSDEESKPAEEKPNE